MAVPLKQSIEILLLGEYLLCMSPYDREVMQMKSSSLLREVSCSTFTFSLNANMQDSMSKGFMTQCINCWEDENHVYKSKCWLILGLYAMRSTYLDIPTDWEDDEIDLYWQRNASVNSPHERVHLVRLVANISSIERVYSLIVAACMWDAFTCWSTHYALYIRWSSVVKKEQQSQWPNSNQLFCVPLGRRRVIIHWDDESWCATLSHFDRWQQRELLCALIQMKSNSNARDSFLISFLSLHPWTWFESITIDSDFIPTIYTHVWHNSVLLFSFVFLFLLMLIRTLWIDNTGVCIGDKRPFREKAGEKKEKKTGRQSVFD